jgi:hypothetical protein
MPTGDLISNVKSIVGKHTNYPCNQKKSERSSKKFVTAINIFDTTLHQLRAAYSETSISKTRLIDKRFGATTKTHSASSSKGISPFSERLRQS